MFYGDNRHGENPLAFLMDLETALARLPHLTSSEKCEHFYLRCKSDSDAEDWYENLERNRTPAYAEIGTILKSTYLAPSVRTIFGPFPSALVSDLRFSTLAVRTMYRTYLATNPPNILVFYRATIIIGAGWRKLEFVRN